MPAGGATSRTKGASGERELARALHEQLGVRLVRRLDQCRTGGWDLAPEPEAIGPVAETLRRMAVEVKRRAIVTSGILAAWWAQACAQAAGDCWPVLAYRADRAEWRVRLPLAAFVGLPESQGQEWAADLSLPGFCALVRESKIRRRIYCR